MLGYRINDENSLLIIVKISGQPSFLICYYKVSTCIFNGSAIYFRQCSFKLIFSLHFATVLSIYSIFPCLDDT